MEISRARQILQISVYDQEQNHQYRRKSAKTWKHLSRSWTVSYAELSITAIQPSDQMKIATYLRTPLGGDKRADEERIRWRERWNGRGARGDRFIWKQIWTVEQSNPIRRRVSSRYLLSPTSHLTALHFPLWYCKLLNYIIWSSTCEPWFI